MSTLELGQKLWFVPTRDGRSWAGPEREVKVEKIGRKWATIDERSGLRIEITTLTADGVHASPGRCYLTREAWETERDAGRSWDALRDALRNKYYHRPAGLTADRIREAASLLGIDFVRDGEK